ncbi:MAG: TRAP transporter substrate-binding protein DctP [Hyphomicrobiaceae bacterium]|nr:TRAP transporter substrate-binding protein DctP [Hyphomicrobiaceae bacterium]
MKSLKLVLLGTVAGFFLATAPAPLTGSAIAAEVDGPKVKWKVNVWGKRRAFTEDLETFAKIADEKTGGKFQIKIFYGDQLGGKKQNLDNLKAGVFDMAKVCWAYHPGKNQSLTVLNLPFLPVTNFDVQRKVAEAVYKHPITSKELSDKWGIFALSSSQLPQYEFLGKGTPPKTIKDWNGLTVRALGGLADAMRALGANVSTMTATEVYQAIDRGAVNAVSFPFSYAHSAYKIDEVAEWYTLNLAPGTNDCPNVVSQKSWDALPEQYRKLLTDAKDEAYSALKAAYKKKDDVNIPKWRKTKTEIKYTDAELDNFRKVGGQPVYEKWVATNKDKFDAQSLLDFVIETAKSGQQ